MDNSNRLHEQKMSCTRTASCGSKSLSSKETAKESALLNKLSNASAPSEPSTSCSERNDSGGERADSIEQLIGRDLRVDLKLLLANEESLIPIVNYLVDPEAIDVIVKLNNLYLLPNERLLAVDLINSKLETSISVTHLAEMVIAYIRIMRAQYAKSVFSANLSVNTVATTK